MGINESDMIEYKDYGYKYLTEPQGFDIIKRTICSFLNKWGGLILVGVDDQSVIKDKLKIFNINIINEFFNNQLVSNFHPPLNQGNSIDVTFDIVPVKVKGNSKD